MNASHPLPSDRSIILKYILLGTACLGIMLWSHPTKANDALPQLVPVSTDSTPRDNILLDKTLQLQQQIQLLKSLIERESAVNQMAEAALKINLNDPVLPAPARPICAELPANIPCAQAYPELYPDFDVASVTPVRYAPPVIESAVRTAKPSKTEKAAPIETQPPPFVWLDIRCLKQKCTALIAEDINNSKTFQRVNEGQTIGEMKITAISASGITVKYPDRSGDRSIRLNPAPRR
jgi:hypothetical protein